MSITPLARYQRRMSRKTKFRSVGVLVRQGEEDVIGLFFDDGSG
jgi:hypothetical protein